MPDFVDDFRDNWLHVLREFLTKIARNKVADVRPVLKLYRDRFHEYN